MHYVIFTPASPEINAYGIKETVFYAFSVFLRSFRAAKLC